MVGETSPVKKRILPADSSSIQSIEILNLNIHQALVSMDKGVTVIVDESMIGFSNSQVVSTSDSFTLTGVVCWVGTETRALNSSVTVDIHRSSPFSEYSSKGFLMSIIAMLTLATIDTIVAYYYYYNDGAHLEERVCTFTFIIYI